MWYGSQSWMNIATLTRPKCQPEADLEFASRIFKNPATDSPSTADRLLPAFFALDRYCQRRPNDACALHLFALICERLGHAELAFSLLRRCTRVLESEYEESEDPTIEWQFVVANASLARIMLLQKEWKGALETWQNMLGLLGDGNNEEGERKTQKTVLQVQARFAIALATFEMDDIEDAMGMFQEALAIADETPQLDLRGNVAVLSSKLLWAVGSEEARESAKAQLFEWHAISFLFLFLHLNCDCTSASRMIQRT
jgi:superkiller protein 3